MGRKVSIRCDSAINVGSLAFGSNTRDMWRPESQTLIWWKENLALDVTPQLTGAASLSGLAQETYQMVTYLIM